MEGSSYYFDTERRTYSFQSTQGFPSDIETNDIILNLLHFSLNINVTPENEIMEDRERVDDPSQWPYSAIGRIFWLQEYENRLAFKDVGTGFLVGPDGPYYMLTAGHCLPMNISNRSFPPVWFVTGIQNNNLENIGEL